MAQLRKVTLYVLDLNDPVSDKEMTYYLSDMDYMCVKVDKIEHADIGEWHDDHPLNKKGGDFESYFKK